MAISLFSKFLRNKETQETIESDAALLALPIGTVIQKSTGEEYTKISANVFDKLVRVILSKKECDERYMRLHYENEATENNTFTKDVAVKGTLTTNNLNATGLTDLKTTTITDVTANNANVTNKLSAKIGHIESVQAKTMNPPDNNTGNIGTQSKYWANAYITEMYGTAQHARYSDLAEKYETDKEYKCGTVLEVGPKYLTEYNGGAVAGVVSTKPGLTINSELQHGQFVCLKGLVPTLCKGDIKKGQYCIATSGGVVTACDKKDITSTMMLDIVGVAMSDSKQGTVLVKI